MSKEEKARVASSSVFSFLNAMDINRQQETITPATSSGALLQSKDPGTKTLGLSALAMQEQEAQLVNRLVIKLLWPSFIEWFAMMSISMVADALKGRTAA